jgi:hypothetical protein
MQQMLRQRQARQATAAAEAAEARRIAAATQLQNQRVEQSLNAARERRQRYAEQHVAADAADTADAAAEGKQEAIARQQEIYNRRSQRETQYNARRANTAAIKIQKAFKNKKAIQEFANMVLQKALRTQEEKGRRIIAEQKYIEKLARAQAYSNSLQQAEAQAEAQRIAQLKQVLRANKPQKRESNANVEKLVNDYMIRKISMPEFELYQSLDNAGKQRFIEEIRQKVQNQPAILIKSVLRGHKGRKQYEQDKIDRLVQLSIEAQQMGQMQQWSPRALTALSGATTVAEQEQAGLRKPRSDLGSTRAPYATKKKMEKEQKQLMKGLTPEERRILQQEQTQAQTRST